MSDEKVVAWRYEFFEFSEGWLSGLSPVHPENFRAMPNETPTKWRNPEPLIPQSAYAELEKHSERIEVAYLASESRAEDAESQAADLSAQLAELRGKLPRVLHALDCLQMCSTYRLAFPDDEIRTLHDDLRTLAAADGSTTGDTK